MIGDWALLMFPALFLLIFMGFPVAFSLFTTAFVFGVWAFWRVPGAIWESPAFFQVVQQVEGTVSNWVLAAVPLFVFMGSMLERSGIAERLFEAVHLWTRRLPGGLAIGTVIMCVIFAASTGVIGATEAVVGLLAIPPMLRFKYDKALISGTICAGGSLGTIIPPSVVVVVLGPVADVSIGDLMVGMVFPGLILSGLYIAYILGIAILRPETAPRGETEASTLPVLAKLRITAVAMVPPVLMIVAVLGSIMFGWAAPTEAAALGALASVILTLAYGRFTWPTFWQALVKTLMITAMIMFILTAGAVFTGTFAVAGGTTTLKQALGALDLGPWALLFLFLAVVFIAGFFLEWISVILIFVPIFMPFIEGLHDPVTGFFDPRWFCMLILVMIQTSYLTPPMAPAIFYLRGIAPPEITLAHMYRGVVPFLVLQVICLLIVMLFPATALWLPEQLLGFN